MPPVRFGPKDLLEYDANYGVIICRECKYAIQKSALQSHLLRHKIFRHERHNLLSSIAQLSILEPDDVPLPHPSSKPVESLPTIPGFRCSVVGCDSLYASSKRMRRHQLEAHNISEVDTPASMARSVTLQTFFRGTKIKYFEVTSKDHTRASNPKHDVIAADEVAEEVAVLPEGQSNPQPQKTAAVPFLPSTWTGTDARFNMQSLVYFHHFLSITSCTLPLSDPKYSLYWKTEFVNQALQQEWLMAGLLALSASHMGVLAHRASTALAHHDRSIALCERFEEGRKTQTQGVFNTSYQGTPTPREGVLGQISCIIACARTRFATRVAGQQATLEDLITSMRGLITAESALRPSDFQHSDNDAFGRAARLLNMTAYDPVLANFLKRLDSLPIRLAEALGKPEDLRDVVIALSAIATLIDSCVAGFEADEVAFWAMATWLSKAAEEFHQMLARDNPAALVVLAHWAASLVRRVEGNECWFLRGATQFILARVNERLPLDRPVIRSLIEDLEVMVGH